MIVYVLQFKYVTKARRSAECKLLIAPEYEVQCKS